MVRELFLIEAHVVNDFQKALEHLGRGAPDHVASDLEVVYGIGLAGFGHDLADEAVRPKEAGQREGDELGDLVAGGVGLEGVGDEPDKGPDAEAGDGGDVV